MIEKISGTVTFHSEGSVHLSVPPLTLALIVPAGGAITVGATIELYTTLHWNSENGYTLFGFFSSAEKMLFAVLIECNGVGPKLAMTILSSVSPEQLLAIVHQEQIDALKAIPGIGQKKAEQIILSLRHSLKKLEGLITPATTDGKQLLLLRDVEQALSSLQYSKGEITRTMRILNEQNLIEKMNFDQLLRAALATVSRK